MATICTITRSMFATDAKPLKVTITNAEGKVVFEQYMSPRTFSTNGLGWNANGKAQMDVTPSTPNMLQVGVNVSIVGSKELPLVESKPAPKAEAPKGSIAGIVSAKAS